jgi:hypothetical protein
MKKILLAVPAYNEEKVLANSIMALHSFMEQNIRHDWSIVIAENGSTDKTKSVALKLAERLPNIQVVSTESKGRGYSLKQIWANAKADVYAYCDADLATDLRHLKEMFDAVLGGYNIALGSRYLAKSDADRALKRRILSRGYNYLVRKLFDTGIKDFQCGFKAIDRATVNNVLSKTRNREWFFDTELLLRAEKKGYSIKEIPVKWKENNDSKVNLAKTIVSYINNLLRLRFSR